MPPKSEVQRGWAHANKDKPTAEGRAAADYAASDPGGPLPARIGPPPGPKAPQAQRNSSLQSLVNRSPHRG